MTHPVPPAPLRLFEGFGVELEYMLVDAERLSVLPIADRVLEAKAGAIVGEVEAGALCWSNELVLHVIEFKTNGPAPQLAGLDDVFAQHVQEVNGLLARHGACLMPTAMHPWMDPDSEARLWPHEASEIYGAFDRIFDCRGHGWSNLQSTHLNLPFSGDAEFGRLHAAIRLILPILPAIAASSPLLEGEFAPNLDQRLEVYRHNAARIPSITGGVIPEPAYAAQTYQREILEPMYRAIAPHDPQGILQHEWLNARGAIARFDRGAIEIRLLDVQECPRMDLAVVCAVARTAEFLARERWAGLAAQQAWPVAALARILRACIAHGEQAHIDDAAYLAMFGYPGRNARAGALWRHLVEALTDTVSAGDQALLAPLEHVFRSGTLARRIRKRLETPGRKAARKPATPSRSRLHGVYAELCACLAANEPFS